MKQFYIIMSTIGAFMAMDFIYTGEFPHNQFSGDCNSGPADRTLGEIRGWKGLLI
jgi:hypothetical protein